MRFDAKTKKINSGIFPLEYDYSKNSEYIEMIKSKNYIEVSQEEFDLWKSNNQNGIEMCVIDGVLQPFVESDDVKLEKAKELKLSELKSFYSSNSAWQCTLKAVDGTLTRDKNWLRDNITLTSSFKNDQGVEFVKSFTLDEVFKIRDDLQAFGNVVRLKKEAIESKINSAEKIADIEKIDIEKEFEVLNRTIEIA